MRLGRDAAPRIVLASALASAALAPTSRAAAAPLSADLAVERASGTDDCPDAASLSRIIEGIVSSANTPALVRPGGDVRTVVRFSRLASAYQASLLLAGKREGERTLTDTGPNCAALGRAVGITIALLLDAGRDVAAESAMPAAARTAPASLTAAGGAPVPPPRATNGALAVTLGPALGLVGGPSLAMGLALVVGVRQRVALALDGQYVASRSTAFDSGEVDVALVASRLRVCGVFRRGARLRAAACAEGAAGRLRGEGHGYPSADRAATLGWIAAGAGAAGTFAIGRRWQVGLSADALAPLHRSTFSIANRGVAYRSSAVSALFAASVGVVLW